MYRGVQMKRFAVAASLFVAFLAVAVPVVGGGLAELSSSAQADSGSALPPPPPTFSGAKVVGVASATAECFVAPGDATPAAPGTVSTTGIVGTTTDDLAQFAAEFNEIRIAHCLEPIPSANFFVDTCMEARLFWMAESPSPDPLDAWGHSGSERIDGVPSVGCDGNLAGGTDNTGATVAQKWWESPGHRTSLYRPDSGIEGACIAFAMTHGGIDEDASFVRSAARWMSCSVLDAATL